MTENKSPEIPEPQPYLVSLERPAQESPQSLPQPTTKPAETGTTPDLTLLIQLQETVAKAIRITRQLQGFAHDDEKSETVRRLEARAQTLRDHDIVIWHDIRVWDKQGEIFRINDELSMPYFTEADTIGESRRNFETVLYGAVFRPVLSRIHAYIERFVENENKLPPEPPFGTHDVNPTIPAPRSQTFISDTK